MLDVSVPNVGYFVLLLFRYLLLLKHLELGSKRELLAFALVLQHIALLLQCLVLLLEHLEIGSKCELLEIARAHTLLIRVHLLLHAAHRAFSVAQLVRNAAHTLKLGLDVLNIEISSDNLVVRYSVYLLYWYKSAEFDA